MTKLACTLSVLIACASIAVAQPRRGGRSAVTPSGESNPPIAKSESEKRVLQAITDAVSAGALYANVPAADGRLLRMLAESTNAKHIVEIGTSTGISGLWFSLALDRTGGKLMTFEYDAGRAATAKKQFQQAGVDGMITIVQGDAHQTISRLKEPIDLVFIDADKEGYVDYLNKLLPLVRPGGLILAHNVDMVPDYMKVVTSRPDLETILYMHGGGMAVTMKKR
jgi:predicted O-methyltransferase YrrM